ncbi:hypothetical protein [Aneurinibacillus thermoaerophilus]|uniref:Cell-wall binding lipoprotein n=1 Tax=Aneurinibacillus thermoaerophilus TaxID=143495 RepID=A0ABX8YEE3_ANETH|nr:hypothetical protein [Aneurinibacillus thermoaerophilus]MED0736284.1 hypothetical protein [Aneurinibacillus thermoaerophilus]QYY44093.1 hypothetical protein K3F53_07905 [Aneurinibacillus thermoaerophilus]
MEKQKKGERFVRSAGLVATAALLLLTGCTTKENLPTDNELSAKIAEKQEQKRKEKITNTKEELDRYFASLASHTEQLHAERAALLKAFAALSEQKLTEQQTRAKVHSAISAYEAKLKDLQEMQVPAYQEIQDFHQEMYSAMSRYVPVMKKAEKGLRTKNASLLKEAEKEMHALDVKAKQMIEKTAKLHVKIRTN